MYAVRRILLVLAAVALVLLPAGCGSSITAVTPRTSSSATAQAMTPFCEAVQQSRVATEPVSRIVPGQRIADIGEIADRVRAANQQLGALAPTELRADLDRLSAVTDRRLRLLEDNGGDTLALVRDPDVARETTDPQYSAASNRVSDYVRRTC